MNTPHPTAYFELDGDEFVPTSLARGPWGRTISGNVAGGLLGYAIEQAEGRHAEHDLRLARLTVDLIRPITLAPVRTSTRVVRQGRRLHLVHADVTQDGVLAATASALLLRPGDTPPGRVWTSAVEMPPLPVDVPDPPAGTHMTVWAFGSDAATGGYSVDLTAWQHHGPKYVWVRNHTPIVPGTPLTPLVRAAMAGDVASSLTHYGTEGLRYINADYTVTLSRLPVGSAIGLAALTHNSADGIATGSAALFDGSGPIGTASATALANAGFAPPSRG